MAAKIAAIVLLSFIIIIIKNTVLKILNKTALLQQKINQRFF